MADTPDTNANSLPFCMPGRPIGTGLIYGSLFGPQYVGGVLPKPTSFDSSLSPLFLFNLSSFNSTKLPFLGSQKAIIR